MHRRVRIGTRLPAYRNRGVYAKAVQPLTFRLMVDFLPCGRTRPGKKMRGWKQWP